MSEGVIRVMEESDLDAVVDIEAAAYDFPWPRGIFTDCINSGYECRVLDLDQVVAAYTVMSLGPGESHVLNLAVHLDYRRLGLARALLDALTETSRRHRVGMMFLEVRESNAAARILYERYGFNEISTRPRYYRSARGREDAVLLARTLWEEVPR